ncbi:MAG: hypothetical protein U0929_08580 [Planctomycetaceae bacterium]
MDESLTPPPDESASAPVEYERRVYVPHYEGWSAQIKTNWDKDYCYTKNPGEDYFHLLLCGEVYLANGEERLCLNCAKRRGVITDDRLYWQRGVRRAPPPAF